MKYSNVTNQHLYDTNESADTDLLGGGVGGGGADVTTVTLLGVEQSDENIISHAEDTDNSRVSVVKEYVSGTPNVINNDVDFDLADEAKFIQENAATGTDFSNGIVTLHELPSGNFEFVKKQEVPNPLAGETNFGKWCKISGVIALVGDNGYADVDGYADDGTVHMYKTYDNGETWVHKQQLRDPSPAASRYFGWSADLDGEIVVVGTYYGTTTNGSTGTVNVFKTPDNGETWVHKQELGEDANLSNVSNLGTSVAVDGDIIVSGAPGYYNGSSTCGCAVTWTTSDSGETWDFRQKLVPIAGNLAACGGQVALKGDALAIGEPGNKYVCIYTTGNGGITWDSRGNFKPTGVDGNTMLGSDRLAFATNRSLLAADSGYDDDSGGGGVVFVFSSADGVTWTNTQMIDGAAGNYYFGSAVGADGDTAIIGESTSYVSGVNCGRCYVYKSSDGGVTYSEDSVIEPALTTNLSFGWGGASIDNTSGNILVASYDAHDGYKGSVYFYKKEEIPNYLANTPVYITTGDASQIPIDNMERINSVTFDTTIPAGTSIKALASFDDRQTWMKWNGASWELHVPGLGDFSTANTPTELRNGFFGYTISTEFTLDFAFQFETTDILKTPSIDQITLNYDAYGTFKTATHTDFEVEDLNTTQVKVTKLSTGTSIIKVTVTVQL